MYKINWCVHHFKPKGPRHKATVWISQLCFVPALCVAMSEAIVCPLEFIVFPLLTTATACMSVVIWSSTRCGKDQLSFGSHCHLKQKKTTALPLLKKPLDKLSQGSRNQCQPKPLATTTTDNPPVH